MFDLQHGWYYVITHRLSFLSFSVLFACCAAVCFTLRVVQPYASHYVLCSRMLHITCCAAVCFTLRVVQPYGSRYVLCSRMLHITCCAAACFTLRFVQPYASHYVLFSRMLHITCCASICFTLRHFIRCWTFVIMSHALRILWHASANLFASMTFREQYCNW
jgi:hypothetical protein